MTKTLDINCGRKESRYPIRGMTVRCIRSQGADDLEGEVVEGDVLDLSPSGAKLLVVSSVRISESLGLHIFIPELNLEIDVTAAVCWSRPADDFKWFLGCSFSPRLSEDVLGKLATRGFIERRHKPRRPLNVNGSLTWQLTDQAVPVIICDVSSGGFNITIDQPPPIEQKVMLHLANSSGTELIIAADVQWAIHGKGHHLVGCAFKNRADYHVFREMLGEDPEESNDDLNSPNASARKWLVATWLLIVGVVIAVFIQLFTSTRDIHVAETVPKDPAPVADLNDAAELLLSASVLDEQQSAIVSPISKDESNTSPDGAPIASDTVDISAEDRESSSELDDGSAESVTDDFQPTSDPQVTAMDGPDAILTVASPAENAVDDTTRRPIDASASASHGSANLDGLLDTVDLKHLDNGDTAADTAAPDDDQKVVELKKASATVENTATPLSGSPMADQDPDPKTEIRDTTDIAFEQGRASSKVDRPHLLLDDVDPLRISDDEPVQRLDENERKSHQVNIAEAGRNYVIGDRLFRQRRYSEAAKSFQTAVLNEPANPLYHYLLAMAQFQMENTEEATRNLEVATRLEKSRPIENWGRIVSRYQGSVRLWVESHRSHARDRP